MAKGKKTLKAALVSQQTRLKNNQQAKEAAQAAELRDRVRRDVALKREGGGLGGMLKKSLSSSSTASTSSSLTSTPTKNTTPNRKRFVAAAASSATPSPSSKPSPRRAAPASTIPFAATDRILLVGEGDFSFAHALVVHPPLHCGAAALAHLPPANVVATAYDGEDECYAKYPRAATLVGALRERGARVVFGVDATRLDRCTALKGMRFDRVVWNFPHAGASIADRDRNIRANQELLLAFLRSAPSVLAHGRVPQVQVSRKLKRDEDDEDDVRFSDDDADDGGGTRGTVLITLRNVPPYTEWDLPQLAKNPPTPRVGEPASPRYTQLRSFAFHRDDWRGYAHQMTKGERAHGTGTTGQAGEDRTWEFCIS